MKTTYTIPSHVDMYITRPNGEKETVKYPRAHTIDDVIFAKVAKANKDAGRGEITGYKNVMVTLDTPKDEIESNRKAGEFNNTYNEGHTDGYNPHYS